MILTVTLNPAVDHTIQLSEPLVDGSIARTDAHVFTAGGKGINVSHYLHKLDVPTMATGLLGGVTGAFIRDELSQQQFRSEFTDIDGLTRLNTTILTDEDEYKINQIGPMATAEDIESVIQTIHGINPETVVVAGSAPPGVGPRDIDRIATAGSWETAVDVGGDILSSLNADYLICTPNRTELAQATGMETETVSQCRLACQSLRDCGFASVLTSLGTDGAILVTDDTELYAPSLEVPVVDTVGAGDGLFSGVLAAFYDGATADRALRCGVAVASQVVSTAGPRVGRFEAVDDRSQVVTTRLLSD